MICDVARSSCSALEKDEICEGVLLLSRCENMLGKSSVLLHLEQ